MPRIPKRLLALGGLAAGGAAFVRNRRGKATAAPAAATPAAPAPPAPAPTPTPPPATEAGNAAAAPVVAPPPPEAPGPSVNAPTAGGPGSETERAEQAEATVPTPDPAETPAKPVRHSDDDFVAAEEAAAAAEARNIGGPRLDDAHGDPAMEPVYEAGGGEAEGFEAAEDELIENASHGDGRADPIGDAFTPEVESDEETAVYGEPDEERISELSDDETDRR
jgi:hypothetical protein